MHMSSSRLCFFNITAGRLCLNHVRRKNSYPSHSVLPVFRCVNVLERNVEKCSIYTNINDHHITFKLFCKHGVIKTYNLMFQECDPLQAVFAKHMCPNILKVHSRLLADTMIHFPTSQEEVTLSVSPMKVCFKSYTEDNTDFSRTMLTEIQLSPDEFDYFQVGVDSEVTFCLKELRGLLVFSEATSAPLSIHFDISGKPIAFSMEDRVLEASFILATLCEVGEETAALRPACFSQQLERSKTCPGKPEKTPVGKKSHVAAHGSQKPQRNGNALNTRAANPASPLVKQESKNTPGAAKREKASAEGPAPTEGPAALGAEAMRSQQFHSFFFGAVSCKERDAVSHTFHSLATASDTEEDFGAVQSSQVL
ncbi:cell cycle checkpoint control protein RAD9B [Athene cunicularia]|uniref:cell cycle checkpoint control protein RAD9B n=1 Tax=Athene cunicularia TaxID=194338 RepID=UPI000EF70064|nr:cell cycle checkpoint control protein RAD9B [Athene cunicularia]